MRFGYFMQPNHPPTRSLKDGYEWDLEVLRTLDACGFEEAWIGEHHTSPWEPNPAPDLLCVEGFRQTETLRIGPGGFLLPYHHPAELAHRAAFMDHLSEGRLLFGMAASGLPSDWQLFNVDGLSGTNRDMTREALDIILKMWTEEAFDHQGRYWKVTRDPEGMFGLLRPHLKPVQQPHPPIGVTGLSKGSETLKMAGEFGFLPLSLNLSIDYVKSHWASIEEGAARAGRIPSRRDWRHVREIVVAETDAEAWKLAVEGPMGRLNRDYLMPLFTNFGFLDNFKHHPDVPDTDVTVEYCAKHNWVVGSPNTVAEKLEAMYDAVGGYGETILFGVDYADEAEAWKTSLGMLMREVAPKLKHLEPKPAPKAAE